jgi:hypothetical protein
LRFIAADGTEPTRRDHAAPPVLDEHRERVLAWLDQPGDGA